MLTRFTSCFLEEAESIEVSIFELRRRWVTRTLDSRRHRLSTDDLERNRDAANDMELDGRRQSPIKEDPIERNWVSKAKGQATFSSHEQFERCINRQDLTVDQQHELWASLLLTAHEISESLAHVKENEDNGLIYPMFVFAAQP